MDKNQTSLGLSQTANSPSRKRQLHSNDDAEPRTKQTRTTQPTSRPARLTRRNLALLNKMVKQSEKTGEVPTAASDVHPSSAKTLSSGFAEQAYKNGILHPLNSKPPANLQEIRERLVEARATPSPPESVYEDYVHTIGMAPNEATVVVETSGMLLKKYDDKGYGRAFNQAFTSFPADVGFNNELSAPRPDFVEGLRRREYAPFPVEEYISGAILDTDDPYSLALPHLAGEWKGPGGDMGEATLKSGFDGAALVYTRNQALAYQGKSDPPGHASVTTFTTDGNGVNFYAHYAAETEDGTLEYHQFPIKSTSLVNSHGYHKEGRRGLRNEQDHARKQSYELRDQLKEYYKKQRSGGLHPVAEGDADEDEGDADEDEGDANEDEGGADEDEGDNRSSNTRRPISPRYLFRPRTRMARHSPSTPHS